MSNLNEISVDIFQGSWINRDAGIAKCWQYTTTTSRAVVLGLFQILVFGWASPWLRNLVERLLRWLNYGTGLFEPPPSPATRPSSPASVEDVEDSHAPLLGNDAGQQLDNRSTSYLSKKISRLRKTSWSYRISFVITGLLVVFDTAWLTASNFAGTQPAYRSGLVKSDRCGYWTLSNKALPNEQDEQDLAFQAPKERRAGIYQRTCYKNSEIASPEVCSFFVKNKIPYHKTTGQLCPFQNSSMCAYGLLDGGRLSAVTFQTGEKGGDGLIDASILGLNARKAPKLRRTVTCSPLNISDNFVMEVEPKGVCENCSDYRYWYEYGQTRRTEGTNRTFLLPGDPFNWHAPVYGVWLFQSTPYGYGPDTDSWEPRNELKPLQPNAYTTLMFIFSCRILYRGQCNDAIFPADEPYNSAGRALYRNSDPGARPLACVDSREVCDFDGANCFPVHEDSHYETKPAREFTRLAMQRSKIFDSLQFRMGAALLAQESVGQFESSQLQNKNAVERTSQWIEEVEALFATSLARIQFDALDIATGLHSDQGDLYNVTPPYPQNKKLCYKMKIRLPKEYSNVNMLAFTGYLALVVFIWILQLDLERDFRDRTREKQLGESMLVVDWFLTGDCWRDCCSCCGRRHPQTSNDNTASSTGSVAAIDSPSATGRQGPTGSTGVENRDDTNQTGEQSSSNNNQGIRGRSSQDPEVGSQTQVWGGGAADDQFTLGSLAGSDEDEDAAGGSSAGPGR